ncbi:dienelactone hydrolase family protein [uncultured Friedmanniella sp.]|uniref:dienelactone hydrolase family protein n=1 Tax=uncultured Friedmanniella sp. TaxID=335381 RepID=UPI0035CA4535
MSDLAPRQNVRFDRDGTTISGYLQLPPGGRGPGLIVIQEWWGLDDHMVGVVDRFATEGFVALAPDLYGGRVTHGVDEAGQLAGSLSEEAAAGALAGAVDYLLEQEAVTSEKVGAVGYCMGGGFVLLLATERPDSIGAVVPYYGVGHLPGSYAAIAAPVQGHYGETDQMYPVDAAHAQEQQIRDEAGVEVEYFYYPAGHAFANPDDHLGTYDAASAELAWTRTLDFLHAQLG